MAVQYKKPPTCPEFQSSNSDLGALRPLSLLDERGTTRYAQAMTNQHDHDELAITIVHKPDKYRYELRSGDKLIGTAGYLPDANDDAWNFNSTHVDSEYRGRGLAAQLVNFALADAKANGHSVVASCSYVEAYLRKHPELA